MNKRQFATCLGMAKTNLRIQIMKFVSRAQHLVVATRVVNVNNIRIRCFDHVVNDDSLQNRLISEAFTLYVLLCGIFQIALDLND